MTRSRQLPLSCQLSSPQPQPPCSTQPRSMLRREVCRASTPPTLHNTHRRASTAFARQQHGRQQMHSRHSGIGSSPARSGRGTPTASALRPRSTAEWCAARLRARVSARLLSPLTQICAARSQLDAYKAAERERESRRDRSARQRPEDDGAQAAKRKKAKREQSAAEEVAAARQACRAVACTVNANVREGSFVTFNVRPARDMWRVQNGFQRVRMPAHWQAH